MFRSRPSQERMRESLGATVSIQRIVTKITMEWNHSCQSSGHNAEGAADLGPQLHSLDGLDLGGIASTGLTC